jgi:hypothetical protein
MPLIDFYASAKPRVLEMEIKQIVAIAGDGNLKDNSPASAEMRKYLSAISTKHLYRYVDSCLGSSFESSGFVLQDIVNELGARLGYQVEHGLYRGKRNAVGFDGVWKISNNRDILVEVKTTDYYTINLDTIFKYKQDLVQQRRIAPDAMVLFVVGRDDSNSLEAQIRGSRYAWDARLISVESLLQLVLIKERTQDEVTLEKIRALIEPIEYTRLDRLVGVVFLSIEDAEKSLGDESAINEDMATETAASTTSGPKRINITDSDLIEEKRNTIIEIIEATTGLIYKKHRRTQFESSDGTSRLGLAVSKRYDRGQQSYWYAYHPHIEAYLSESKDGFFVLGMMDSDAAYMIPISDMNKYKHDLNTTNKDSRSYWHITLYDTNGEIYLFLPKKGEKIFLEKYKLAPCQKN